MFMFGVWCMLQAYVHTLRNVTLSVILRSRGHKFKFIRCVFLLREMYVGKINVDVV